jgi:aminoglycoside/choline kinase family phosphotransferase
MMNELRELFKKWAGVEPLRKEKLPGSGSPREYYRLQAGDRSAIGAVNAEPRENRAFLSFTRSFLDAGCPVPEIYAANEKKHVYLLQDLGDETLFSRLNSLRKGNREFPGEAYELYRAVVRKLPLFQVAAASMIDYSVCFPRDLFDHRSMMWDLNYFKYYFLKLAGITYDEEALEEDFQRFTGFLCEAGKDHFMYRDFQSRNIMLVNNEPWFIDYQGGRKGALQYDIASLLYDAKADIPDAARTRLLDEYLKALEFHLPADRENFMKYYYGYVLIRILQALGAYGFRGFYENKPHFLQSIPFALENLKALNDKGLLDFGTPMLAGIIGKLAGHPQLNAVTKPSANLAVTVCSFSYKNGLPGDVSGNGGGFIFDCRALPNPGRYGEYKTLSGLDQPVIGFLKQERSVEEFLNHASSIVDQSIRNYIERGFTHLMVSFGCTGGQHRSVYCAEEVARYIRSKYDINVSVVHRELDDASAVVKKIR